MKGNAYERKIDELGRIVLPMEFRQYLSLDTADTLIISLNQETNTIQLSKLLK